MSETHCAIRIYLLWSIIALHIWNCTYNVPVTVHKETEAGRIRAQVHLVHSKPASVGTGSWHHKQNTDPRHHTSGNINHNKQPSLLKFIYQYIEFTGRFKQQ